MSVIPIKQADIKTKQTNYVTEKIIGDKKYIVKSVFVGEQNIRTVLLKLAERKAVKEIGLILPFRKNVLK